MSKILYASQQSYLEELRNEPDRLIREMEEFAKEKKIPILNWNAAEFMEHLVLMYKPKRVLEIGTAIAYTSIRIARNLKKKSEIDTIEMSKDNIAIAKGYVKKAKLEERINIIEGDALQIMPNLEKKYDFIFVDADKEDYERLFYYSLMLLKKGGVMVVDNLLWNGYAAASKVPPEYRNSTQHIREFNKLFSTQYTLKTTILPVGDGMGIGIKIG